MSSNEEDYNEAEGSSVHESKKRRIQRACDTCRRKKIRCDGVQMPGHRCSNCSAYNLDCTYVETAKKRGPSKGYVERLENKVEKMDKLLQRLCPNEAAYKSLLDALEKDDLLLEHEPLDPSTLASAPLSKQEDKTPTLLDTLTASIRGSFQTTSANEDDDDVGISVADDFKCLSIESQESRFFGKSSGFMLIREVIEAKRDYTGPSKWHPFLPFQNIRPEFWVSPQWETPRSSIELSKPFTFPPPDLAEELINNFFIHTNLHLPLLHRPTFQEEVKRNLHHFHVGFACVYLLVCSIGARFSNDPRVLVDGQESLHSAGWKWFQQVATVQNPPPVTPPTLYDVQSYALSVQFLSACSTPQTCWTMLGVGIRLALDVGAHRRRQANRSTAQDELWKRAFWVLVVLDRLFSTFLGRPCAIHEEDFDVDLPTNCDDEYWDVGSPAERFKQPEGKPSKLTGFILFIKLIRLLAATLRTIYAINKTKVLYRINEPGWVQTFVTELDSALNSWLDEIPPYLRWDANRENHDFFNQSVNLYANYYLVQITIHRPFIPTPQKPSPLSFPSLVICANAARSCIHLADIQRRRTAVSPMIHMAICTSGILLLLNLWSGKRSGLSPEVVKKDTEDVSICMRALKTVESRYLPAGRLWDILYELANAGDLPLPEVMAAQKNKRAREFESPSPDARQGKEPSLNEPRHISGPQRVRQETNLQQLSRQSSPQGSSASQHPSPGSTSSGASDYPDTSSIFCSSASSSQSEHIPLPMYSNELGRLPLHGPFNFVARQQSQLVSQTTSPSTSSMGSWYQTIPTFGDNGRSSVPPPISHRSAAPFQQSPPVSFGPVEEMSPLTSGPSSSGIEPRMFPLGTSITSRIPTIVEGRQASISTATMTGWDPYNIQSAAGLNGSSIPNHVSDQACGISQINTAPVGMGLGTMDVDLMSMWLNSPAGLLMDDLSYLTKLNELTRHSGP